MNRNVIFWGLIPVCNALYQIFIKLTAAQMRGAIFDTGWLGHAAAIPWSWAALVSEAAAFFIWMQILSSHDLSKAFPLSAVSYLLILSASWFVFHEKILLPQIIGSALILCGVWLIGTADTQKKAAA